MRAGLSYLLVISLLISACLGFSVSAFAQHPTVFHTPAKETSESGRRTYSYNLLKLALDKTVADYGPYTLNEVRDLSVKRMHLVADNNKYENFIVKLTYSDSYQDRYIYAPFPAEFGGMGYRVCFVAPTFYEESNRVTTLEQLRMYTIGQGVNWPDTKIIRANKINVSEVRHSESLFSMTDKGRFDFFCRGITEPKWEIDQYDGDFPLVLNKSFVLRYTLPRFFYTNKENTAAIERITEGLKRAFNDGSAFAYYESLYQDYIDFVKIKDRTIIDLTNPDLRFIDNSYQQFIIPPDKI